MFDDVLFSQLHQILLRVDVATTEGVLHKQQSQTLGEVFNPQFVVFVPIINTEEVFVLFFDCSTDVEYCQNFDEHVEVQATYVGFGEIFLHKLTNTWVERQRT